MTIYAEDKIEELTTEVSELRTAYENLNTEYANLNNRHTDLQSQYDDCAGRIGIDADKLAQSEQMLQVAHDDVTYLKRSLEHAKRNATLWQERAEGCMAEKDELLTLVDDIRSKGLKTHKDYKAEDEAEKALMACMKLLEVCKDIIMEDMKPGINQLHVMQAQMKFANAAMEVAQDIPGIAD